jgi:hypothetical protein
VTVAPTQERQTSSDCVTHLFALGKAAGSVLSIDTIGRSLNTLKEQIHWEFSSQTRPLRTAISATGCFGDPNIPMIWRSVAMRYQGAHGGRRGTARKGPSASSKVESIVELARHDIIDIAPDPGFPPAQWNGPTGVSLRESVSWRVCSWRSRNIPRAHT